MLNGIRIDLFFFPFKYSHLKKDNILKDILVNTFYTHNFVRDEW